MKPAHIAFLFLICLFWAVNMIAIKESVMAFQPLLSVALRYVFVLLVCAPFLRIVPGRMTMLLISGVVAGALQFGLGGIAFHAANNISALAIAGQLSVPFSLLMAVFIEKERISWPRITGIVLAVTGVMLLVFDPRIVEERFALLLMVLVSLCFAASSLMYRRLTGVSVLNIYGWQAVVSVPLLLAGSALFEPGAIGAMGDAPLPAWGWAVYSAVFASIVGHAGMAWLLQKYPVSMITPFTLPAPLLSVVVASIAYRTPITPLMIVGGILTLIGVTIITLRTARRVVTPL
ncbi:MAG: DMT family transporter [Sphingomonadaceae bacterium]